MLLKLLKSTNNAPIGKRPGTTDDYKAGTWDLMMKNIYSLGASQMTGEKFELYVQYRNDSVGTEMHKETFIFSGSFSPQREHLPLT